MDIFEKQILTKLNNYVEGKIPELCELNVRIKKAVSIWRQQKKEEGEQQEVNEKLKEIMEDDNGGEKIDIREEMVEFEAQGAHYCINREAERSEEEEKITERGHPKDLPKRDDIKNTNEVGETGEIEEKCGGIEREIEEKDGGIEEEETSLRRSQRVKEKEIGDEKSLEGLKGQQGQSKKEGTGKDSCMLCDEYCEDGVECIKCKRWLHFKCEQVTEEEVKQECPGRKNYICKKHKMEEMNQLREEKKETQQSMNNLIKNKQNQEKELKVTKKETDQCKSTIEKLEKQLKEAEQKNTKATDQNNKKWEGKCRELEEENNKLKNELDTLKECINNKEHELNLMATNIAKQEGLMKLDKEQAKNEVANIRKEQKKEMAKAGKDSEIKYENLKKQYNQTNESLQKTKQTLQSKENEVNTYKKHYEGNIEQLKEELQSQTKVSKVQQQTLDSELLKFNNLIKAKNDEIKKKDESIKTLLARVMKNQGENHETHQNDTRGNLEGEQGKQDAYPDLMKKLKECEEVNNKYTNEQGVYCEI